MGQVVIEVGGHSFELMCRDGEEEHLRGVARLANEKAIEAMKSVGRTGETRTLLFATLLLADELQEARAKLDAAPAQPANDGAARIVEGLAERVEALASRLEKGVARA